MRREFIGIMGKLTCELGEEEGMAIIKVGGQADIYTSTELSKILEAYLARGRANLLLDVEDLEYLDSSTLATLLRIQKKATSRGGALKLLKLTGEPRKVFEVSGFLNIFENFDDRGAAIRSFEGSNGD
ncbi:MAG: STAS domain-containing protein [Candidatus Euphemobacter frigidus]|nr:STAS domain-containing protein [Candidatus Euphemobacter frigidus]MDP8276488.1 STAS domain-containing protein [Candidatus Euphemobacter frigidus]